MTDDREPPLTKSVQTAAGDWVVRMDHDPSPQTERELAVWLGRNPAHRRAYHQAVADWQEGGLLSGSRLHTGALVRAPFLLRRTTHIAAAGIGVAAALCVATLWLLPSGGPLPLVRAARATTYETATGEIRQVVLTDGTRVTLDTDTSLTANLTWRERRVQLARGRARFDVKPDRHRLFLINVGAGEAITRAATSDISITGSEAKLVVLAGSLKWRADVRDSGAPPQIVGPGQEFFGGGGRPPARASSAEARWVSGMLGLNATPLAEAISAINRYNKVQIRLADGADARLPVTGGFQARDPEGFAQAIAALFGLRLERSGRTLVLSTPAKGPGGSTPQK